MKTSISRLSHSISVAGKFALAGAAVLFMFLFATILMVGGDGTAPAVTHISVAAMEFTAELVGVPAERAMLATVIVWSLVVFAVGWLFALVFRGDESIPTGEATLPWSLGIVVIVSGAVLFLVRNHQNREEPVDERALAVEFVRSNGEVMQAAGGSGEVDLLGFSQSKNEPATYEVAVYGARTVYAFVEATESLPAPKFKLLCMTPLSYIQRDPSKPPCEQK